MGPRNRAIRAAASALLLAAAIGVAGSTGISSVLAADPVATIPLSGTLVDERGAPLGGVQLVVSEEAPSDGGLAGFQVTTADDGSFSVPIYPWGTADAPARLTITTPQDEEIVVIRARCTRTLGVVVGDSRDLALQDGAAPPAPLALVGATTLRGEICGTTATPRPAAPGGRPVAVTPPPTDTGLAALTAADERQGPALVLGFVLGLVGAVLLLARRLGPRRG